MTITVIATNVYTKTMNDLRHLPHATEVTLSIVPTAGPTGPTINRPTGPGV